MKHKDSKLGQILEAAAVSFYENGFEKSTLRSITSLCGVTHPTIYKHFENKEALAQFFIRQYLEACNDCASALVGMLTAEERFLYFWLVHFTLICEDAQFARFFYEYLENCPDGFLAAEAGLPFDANQTIIPEGTPPDDMLLKIELINSCGAKLGEYCMQGKSDAQTAVEVIVNIMNTLNHSNQRITASDVVSFIQKHSQAELYSRYDMKTGKLYR